MQVVQESTNVLFENLVEGVGSLVGVRETEENEGIFKLYRTEKETPPPPPPTKVLYCTCDTRAYRKHESMY